jgi:L-threonylcarbamoyladenylate synthase|tara:strand:+ start:220 stop:1149 length:930 start_codon:yes stop_codon:yes gene_type:complete
MKNNLSNIKKAIKYLNNNECVGIPTETVYGLAANAYSDKGTLKIFKLKKRPKKNPLIVHYYNLNDLKKDCLISLKFLKLYKKFCPGPISFVLKLKRNSRISNNVTNNKKNIAVRFPRHQLTRRLLKVLKYPLAAPSANLSRKISPVSKKDVVDEFGKKIKFILDGGRSKIGVESTIVSLINKPKILRLGGIERNKINKFLINKNKKKYKIKNIVVPGQGKIHYSPEIPIRLNIKNPKKYEAFMLIKKRKISKKNFFYLSKKKNLKEAAKNLYKTLRIIKKNKFKSIAVEKIPDIGFGETINDRLIRASK